MLIEKIKFSISLLFQNYLKVFKNYFFLFQLIKLDIHKKFHLFIDSNFQHMKTLVKNVLQNFPHVNTKINILAEESRKNFNELGITVIKLSK